MSIRDFVANMTGEKEVVMDAILSQELLVMHHLHYHLTIHNPFRPIEGLLLDIKVSTAFFSKYAAPVNGNHVPLQVDPGILTENFLSESSHCHKLSQSESLPKYLYFCHF